MVRMLWQVQEALHHLARWLRAPVTHAADPMERVRLHMAHREAEARLWELAACRGRLDELEQRRHIDAEARRQRQSDDASE